MTSSNPSSETRVLRDKLVKKLANSGVNNYLSSHKDITEAFRKDDLDALTALDRYLDLRYSTRVILLVVDILRDKTGAHEVADAITPDMLEALMQVSTAIAVSGNNAEPSEGGVLNAHKVCAMVVTNLELEQPVLDLIRKRRIINAGEIAVLLEQMREGSPVLAEGVL